MAITKPNVLSGLETELALDLATKGKTEAPSSQPTESDLLRQLLTKKLAKEAAIEEEQEALQKRRQLAMLEVVKQQIANDAARRNGCSHMKENGKAAIGGQKLQNGHLFLICLHCQQEFDENTLPPALAASIHPGTIGGVGV